MDNMRSHHVKAVKQLLDSSKVIYLYLPPYSPDLNPIEKMWSKLKALFKERKDTDGIGITISYFKRIFNNSSKGLHRVVSFV